MPNEGAIRDLVERWAIAVHAGDLDGVLASEDVAFAYALLRCGTAEELEKDPDNRLRLTIGLRKEDGRWVVAHEHHSFPDKAASA